MTRKDTVTFYLRSDKKWAWRRTNAFNGQVVSTDGGQGYEQYGDAFDAAYDQFRSTVSYAKEDHSQ